MCEGEFGICLEDVCLEWILSLGFRGLSIGLRKYRRERVFIWRENVYVYVLTLLFGVFFWVSVVIIWRFFFYL